MKVAICGAGIAGLTMAERLSALGAEVVLLERSSTPRSQDCMIDFFGPGYEAAEAIGVLPAIQEVSYHVGTASLFDQDGRRQAPLPDERTVTVLDGRLCRVTRSSLENALRDNLPRDVQLRFGVQVSQVSSGDDGVLVTLDEGEQLEADFLVGADGIHSTVRSLVFGVESQFLRYLGFHLAAFVCDAHDLTDARGEHYVLTDAVDRQVSVHALRDGRTAVVAVFRAADPELPGDSRAVLRDVLGGIGWSVPEVLDRCPPAEDIYFDQVAQVEMTCWHKNRVVLLGDACSAVSQLTGQGPSMAVGGAYVLAEQLRRTSSVERAFSFYERLWRPVVQAKQEAGRDTVDWLLPGSPSKLWIRRTALRLAWLPMVSRRINARLIGEPPAVIAMLRNGSPADPADPRLV
ncbi:FAD binding domain protein [Mycobacterium kansasii 732]|uniref:2-heptyl-3-hydroxy-4(1H)-quinolone synthase n=1 Tax=Mycobacterium pseudokansasii TaxID=2341080 RepID=A0A498QTW5_9MYCO|nr:FAD-dependent monooxygenase [Mycobacterium pseudokansasii]ETZ99719.1 FAD binding domain protein [Mycobacterium kansasii 732]KZS63957.1 FAD-dependent oxidoreductase [Mycobacterium kansasii]VAZ96540.1 2-heptyl-3-hydroxy-4(1H)-quinolone synthase [Mycobacterium pseudokansasii]VAZ97917.1 2-heptyl-3-hydroxy-4(1H)-quinolone synthase [Mycobacterium pseudokansasii]VBA51941.1 2-heptyl-3-hydroxy-4(1H)-quinolone synthase [Mycobacterium pseudokansasii]